MPRLLVVLVLFSFFLGYCLLLCTRVLEVWVRAHGAKMSSLFLFSVSGVLHSAFGI